jgi:hypothetical protein
MAPKPLLGFKSIAIVFSLKSYPRNEINSQSPTKIQSISKALILQKIKFQSKCLLIIRVNANLSAKVRIDSYYN